MSSHRVKLRQNKVGLQHLFVVFAIIFAFIPAVIAAVVSVISAVIFAVIAASIFAGIFLSLLCGRWVLRLKSELALILVPGCWI